MIQIGAGFCATVAELVYKSEVILLCLADSSAVESIVLGEDGILANGSTGKLLIDLSSIDPESTRNMAQQLQQQCQMDWVDAPVSGGVSGAQNGELAIMAGGKEAAIIVARLILKPLYRQLTHMGATGSGQISKICNQMIVSCNVLVIAEMMALAKQAGVATDKIPGALAGGFADSKPLQIVGPEIAAESFEPIKWRVKTLLKDLNMALDLSAQQDTAIPMSALAAQLMQMHGNRGYLDQDPSTLIKLFDKI
jgi:3-hydroxyisobutyrate dehydrogenase